MTFGFLPDAGRCQCSSRARDRCDGEQNRDHGIHNQVLQAALVASLPAAATPLALAAPAAALEAAAAEVERCWQRLDDIGPIMEAAEKKYC
jgi:hypothetical protein